MGGALKRQALKSKYSLERSKGLSLHSWIPVFHHVCGILTDFFTGDDEFIKKLLDISCYHGYRFSFRSFVLQECQASDCFSSNMNVDNVTGGTTLKTNPTAIICFQNLQLLDRSQSEQSGP